MGDMEHLGLTFTMLMWLVRLWSPFLNVSCLKERKFSLKES